MRPLLVVLLSVLILSLASESQARWWLGKALGRPQPRVTVRGGSCSTGQCGTAGNCAGGACALPR